MSRSAAEQEIRYELVSWLRPRLHDARIVHELNVDAGKNRIDVAAITETCIYSFEIKSEKDRATRLADQIMAFASCTHHCVAVLHEKHLPSDKSIYADIDPKIWSRVSFWQYPTPDKYLMGAWRMPDMTLAQPHATRLLGLLWREELKDAARRLRLSVKANASRPKLVEAIAWGCSGEQITRAVCGALRTRKFAEADPAIGGDERAFGDLSPKAKERVLL